MSLSLHSSTECGGGLGVGAREHRDMVVGEDLEGAMSERVSSRAGKVRGGTAGRHCSAPHMPREEESWEDGRAGDNGGTPLVVADQPAEGRRLQGREAGDLKGLGNRGEGAATGGEG